MTEMRMFHYDRSEAFFFNQVPVFCTPMFSVAEWIGESLDGLSSYPYHLITALIFPSILVLPHKACGASTQITYNLFISTSSQNTASSVPLHWIHIYS